MALQENPNIQPHKLDSLIVDKHNRNGLFETIEGRYRTHTAKKILNRIDYVKNSYLADAENMLQDDFNLDYTEQAKMLALPVDILRTIFQEKTTPKILKPVFWATR